MVLRLQGTDVHWAHADKSFRSRSLEKIRSTFLGKLSPCFCPGSGKPVKGNVSSPGASHGSLCSLDIVNISTFGVLFHGPSFKFKN